MKRAIFILLAAVIALVLWNRLYGELNAMRWDESKLRQQRSEMKREPALISEAPCDRIGPVRRFLAISLAVWSAFGLYFIIAHGQRAVPTTVPMPSWVPFWPFFTLPYLGMLLMAWLLPVAIRDAERFRACVRAFVLAFLLTMPWWILAPTTLPRPPMPEGWWAGPYLWIATIDPPVNVMPCAHGIGPVVGAWFTSRDRPGWRWPVIGLLLVGLPAIALIWQHRPIDIVLGTVASAIGIGYGELMKHYRSSRKE